MDFRILGISAPEDPAAMALAIGDSWAGRFPPAQPLLVLAGYALGFGFLARRFFRWE